MKSKLNIPHNLIFQMRDAGINPVDVVLYINSSCNLRCKHCYIGNDLLNKSVLLDADSVRSMLMQLGNLDRITILGGEPLLHPDFNRIMMCLKDMSINEKRVTTNLTIIEKIDIEILKELNVRVCVSIDGYDAATHEIIRGKGTFRSTVDNIKLFLKSGIDIEITHTLNSTNISSFSQMVEFCHYLGVKRLNLHRMSLRGNALENQELNVSADVWRSLIDNLESMQSMNGDLVVRYEVGFVSESEYQQLIQTNEYKHHSQGSYYSSRGGHRIVIYPDGHLYMSSEAFGTESYIGTFSNGIFEYNISPLNEIRLLSNEEDSLSQVNHLITGSEKYPIPLSVSFRRSVLI